MAVGECDEYGELLSDKKVKARREYVCEHCRRLIPKGTIHRHYTGKFDGAWFSHRCHLECRQILEILKDECEADTWFFEADVNNVMNCMCREDRILEPHTEGEIKMIDLYMELDKYPKQKDGE